jgi:hypothetical protein
VQRLVRVTLEAQHQHRRGVAGADQAEAVGKVHAQAVDGADLASWEGEPNSATRASSSATTAWCSPSAQGTLSSGVL